MVPKSYKYKDLHKLNNFSSCETDTYILNCEIGYFFYKWKINTYAVNKSDIIAFMFFNFFILAYSLYCANNGQQIYKCIKHLFYT